MTLDRSSRRTPLPVAALLTAAMAVGLTACGTSLGSSQSVGAPATLPPTPPAVTAPTTAVTTDSPPAATMAATAATTPTAPVAPAETTMATQTTQAAQTTQTTQPVAPTSGAAPSTATAPPVVVPPTAPATTSAAGGGPDANGIYRTGQTFHGKHGGQLTCEGGSDQGAGPPGVAATFFAKGWSAADLADGHFELSANDGTGDGIVAMSHPQDHQAYNGGTSISLVWEGAAAQKDHYILFIPPGDSAIFSCTHTS